MKKLSLTILVLFMVLCTYAQDYPYPVKQHEFVRYAENNLRFPADSTGFLPFYQSLDSLLFQGKGQVHIVHIGGSHIQADIWSGQMRRRLQNFSPGNEGGRGFLFPFKMAKTNNPWSYSPRWTGEWEGCRNVQKKKQCLLGLSGVSVTTTSPLSSLDITFRSDMDPEFNRIRVFHNTDASSFEVALSDTNVRFQRSVNHEIGYTEFRTESYLKELSLTFRQTDSLQQNFTLYGLDLGSDLPGFFYHAIGVNGASVPSYLRCSLFTKHMKAVQPDLVVLSIGINDAYMSQADFSPEVYELRYDTLVARIREAAPNAAILFTTNNDSYYKRRYANKNALRVRERMISLAERHQGAVWDMFGVMGGLGSVLTWQQNGLARADKIHFTPDGYRLVGDLLFNSLMQSYDAYLMERAERGEDD